MRARQQLPLRYQQRRQQASATKTQRSYLPVHTVPSATGELSDYQWACMVGCSSQFIYVSLQLMIIVQCCCLLLVCRFFCFVFFYICGRLVYWDGLYRLLGKYTCAVVQIVVSHESKSAQICPVSTHMRS